jgi:triacylglycerol esterase/lipase EstA (alpha/beta hydrolase family)
MQNASNWIYIKRFLCQKGLGPLYTLNLPLWSSIRDYGDQVSQKAKEITQETGSNELTLIGHSMGGLVSLWYAMKIASPGTVRQVITIGSPIAGTHLAKLAIGPNGREMERGSEFVQELGKELGKNSQIPLYHIGSKIDQITVPYSSSLTGRHPEREYLVDDLGHMTLLMSSRIARKIEEWLRGRPTITFRVL